jgi:hypothetical protein
VKVTCKYCGSENIVENNNVVVGYPVDVWELDDGEPRPVSYHDSNVFWDTTEANDLVPYFCGSCDKDLTKYDLVVKP